MIYGYAYLTTHSEKFSLSRRSF